PQLPGRYPEGDPGHHDDRAAEGDHARPYRERPTGILYGHRHDDKGEHDGHGDRQHQGLRLLRVLVDGAPYRGEKGGIEEIAADKIEKETTQDQPPVRRIHGALDGIDLLRGIPDLGGRAVTHGIGLLYLLHLLPGVMRDETLRHDRQPADEHDPEEKLCQTDGADTGDLTHHQLKRFYRADDHFGDAVCLFLHHSTHDHRSIDKGEQIDQETAD